MVIPGPLLNLMDNHAQSKKPLHTAAFPGFIGSETSHSEVRNRHKEVVVPPDLRDMTLALEFTSVPSLRIYPYLQPSITACYPLADALSCWHRVNGWLQEVSIQSSLNPTPMLLHLHPSPNLLPPPSQNQLSLARRSCLQMRSLKNPLALLRHPEITFA